MSPRILRRVHELHELIHEFLTGIRENLLMVAASSQFVF